MTTRLLALVLAVLFLSAGACLRSNPLDDLGRVVGTRGSNVLPYLDDPILGAARASVDDAARQALTLRSTLAEEYRQLPDEVKGTACNALTAWVDAVLAPADPSANLGGALERVETYRTVNDAVNTLHGLLSEYNQYASVQALRADLGAALEAWESEGATPLIVFLAKSATCEVAKSL